MMVSDRVRFIRRRRRRILYYLLYGLDQRRVCEKVAEEFNCSLRTVKRDLDNLEDWLLSMFYMDDISSSAYRKFSMDYFELEAILWSIKDSDKKNVSPSALFTLVKLSENRFNLMERIGLVDILFQYNRDKAVYEARKQIAEIWKYVQARLAK